MTNVVEIDVRATDNATKTIDEVRSGLTSLGSDTATPTVSLKGADTADTEIKSVSSELSSLGRQSATATVRLSGTSESIAQAEGLLAELNTLGRETATPNVELKGAATTIAESAAVSDAVKKVGSSGEGAVGGLEGLGSSLGKLSNVAMPALVGAGVVMSPIITTMSVGMGGLGLAAEQTISPIIAASQATGGLKANMSTLTPVQQGMAQGLIGLQGQVGKFTNALQPEVVSIWGGALKLAGGVLGDIQPVAKATGDALSGVVDDIGADLKTGEWQSFFQFMANSAGPDVQLLGTLFTGLMNDLPPLFEALQPVAVEFVQLATGVTQAIGALENLPAKLNAVSDSNDSLLSKASDFLNWVGSKIPAGNQTLLDLAENAGKSSKAVADIGPAAQKAAPAVGTLAGDVDVLNSSTSTATQNTKAFTDEWNIFVGKSVGDQQAVLGVKSAFDNYNQTLKTNKSDSDAAQTGFLGIITAFGSGLSTLQTNGASINTINSYYKTNIDRLNSLHGLTPAERADIQGLTKDYNAWANSVSGLTGKVTGATTELKNGFLVQLGLIGAKGPGITTDVNNLANSIQKTGTTSSSTNADRAKLIQDLEKAGVNATTAKQDVNNFTTALGNIPKSVSSSIKVSASSSGALTAAAKISGTSVQNIEDSLLFGADGMKVTGGTPGRDSVVAALMPGEVVVPTHMVNAGEVDHLRGKIPGFAAGGKIDLNAPSHFVQNDENTWATDVVKDWMSKSIGAFNAAEKKAMAEVAALSTTNSLIHPTGSGASVQALMQSMAASVGWTGAEWTALNNVEEREAGYNLTAQNPTSNAYGLAQFINGASEYAQYGGNANTAQGQITGMLNYIKQRYGDPEAAWAHEVNYGWYDNGGWLKPGYTMAYNGTGQPEAVGGAGGAQVINLVVSSEGTSAFDAFMLKWMRENVRVQGGVGANSVQQAFGRG